MEKGEFSLKPKSQSLKLMELISELSVSRPKSLIIKALKPN